MVSVRHPRLMSDEGFHEIQLNGKQLVFLFMAATVVSVVIFLCGVMVGRGVRAQQVTAGPADVSVVEAPVRPEAPAPEPPPPATAAAKAEPPQPEDDYQAELTRSEPGKEPKVAPRETPTTWAPGSAGVRLGTPQSGIVVQITTKWR